jgi:hypothetical protein
LGTLATGALKNAVNAIGIAFPSEFVLMFGLYYSALIALAYAPSYLALQAAGQRLLDANCPIPAPDTPTFVPDLERRTTLEGLLQLNVAASATFKSGVAILTPLFGSLVGLLLGHGN